MNPLARFVVERAGPAWALAVLVAALLGWAATEQLRAQGELDRLERLTTAAERRSIEIMSITLNGNMMGSVAMLGLINGHIKQEVRGKLPANNPQVLPILETIGRSYDADGVFVVAENGIIASSWDNAGKSSTSLDVRFRPYYQMAMQGRDNVYAAVSIARGDRALYFSAPVFNETTNGTQAIGAVVARAGLLKVDHLMRDTSDFALLLSPQGVVFASNRSEWIGHLAGKPAPERLQAIRSLKQFGNLFENKEPALLPLATERGLHRFDGRRFAVATARVQWNDPFGDWTLVLTEDLDRTLPARNRYMLGILVALGFLLIGTLILSMLKSHYRQALATRQLEVFARDQEASATRKTQQAATALRLQRAGSQNQLIQAFLAETHTLLGVLQGVVYVTTEDASVLTLAGSYACAESPPATLRPGENLLGQCAVEQRGQVLETAPEGFGSIRSGLGETRPVALVLAPILLNDKLLGVMELAMLRVPDAADLELCQELAGMLAMNLEIISRVVPTAEAFSATQTAEQARIALEAHSKEAPA